MVPNGLVVLLGVGTVFVGLVCIILICTVVGLFFKKAVKPQNTAPVAVLKPKSVNSDANLNHSEILAAVSAAIAEESGEDIDGLRILSFKKIN